MAPSAEAINAVLARMPYAGFLGVRAEFAQGAVTLVLPYKEELIGNPVLPALHGGVIGAFLEITALTQLAVATGDPKLAKTIDIQADYLRSGRPQTTYARAAIVKIGRVIANVQAEAWQAEPAKPIALLHGHFLVSGETGAEEPAASWA